MKSSLTKSNRRYVIHRAKDGKRLAEKFEAAKDARVLLVLGIAVTFGNSWAEVAATLKLESKDSDYIIAGGFLALSFLTGWLYIECRGWRQIIGLLSILIDIVRRPINQAADSIRETTNEEPPKLTELKGLTEKVAQGFDKHDKAVFEWADFFARLQSVLLLAAVVFYLLWLYSRAV